MIEVLHMNNLNSLIKLKVITQFLSNLSATKCYHGEPQESNFTFSITCCRRNKMR